MGEPGKEGVGVGEYGTDSEGGNPRASGRELLGWGEGNPGKRGYNYAKRAVIKAGKC